ncbi:MAG: sigma factor [Candidatus Saccharicenans sp.]|nr:sigma factor [Candidatus Saccharicenans sp.]
MSFARSLARNRAEAEDTCQDMILQMLRHLDRIEEISNLESLAFTILYWKCLDQLRRRRRFLNFLPQRG